MLVDLWNYYFQKESTVVTWSAENWKRLSVEWIGLLALLAAFIFARLPLSSGYFVPLFAYDSSTYFSLAHDINTRVWPIFDERTPGYPLFLWGALTAFGSIRSVLILQHLGTLVAACLIYLCLVRPGRLLIAPFALLAALGIACSPEALYYNMYLLPESLYANALMATLAALIWGFQTGRSTPFLFASLLMAIAVLLRPAGMFLVVIYGITLFAIWRFRFSKRSLLAFALLFPIVLLGLAAYNKATFDRFTVSPWGAVNLLGATATFWETSPRYPSEVNRAIENARLGVDQRDSEVLVDSVDPAALVPIYAKYFNAPIHLLKTALGTRYSFRQELLYKISFDAIAAHPRAYVKFVLANFWQLIFAGNDCTTSDYYQWVDYGYGLTYGSDSPVRLDAVKLGMREYMWREYFRPVPNPRFALTGERLNGQAVARRISDSDSFKTYEAFRERYYDVTYNGRHWFYLLSGLGGLAMMFLVLGNRETRKRGTVGILAVLYVLGAAGTVALVEVALDRYMFPTRFIYYLTPALLMWLAIGNPAAAKAAFVNRAPRESPIPHGHPTGADTMSSELKFASNYHRWTNDWIAPYVAGKVLDIGGGTGNHISLLQDNELVSIDLSTECIDDLKKKYAFRRHWDFMVDDITDPQSVDRLGRESFDTVLSCNVFEHLEDDRAAFIHARELLRAGGRLILILPAHGALYGAMDRLAGHFRRYDRAMMRERLRDTGFAEMHLRYVNMVGAVGWFVNNRIFCHTHLSSPPINRQIRLFDRYLIPLLRTLEGKRSMPFGQSIVCVATTRVSDQRST